MDYRINTMCSNCGSISQRYIPSVTEESVTVQNSHCGYCGRGGVLVNLGVADRVIEGDAPIHRKSLSGPFALD